MIKSNLTAWCDQNLSNHALNALTVLAFKTGLNEHAKFEFKTGSYEVTTQKLIASDLKLKISVTYSHGKIRPTLLISSLRLNIDHCCG